MAYIALGRPDERAIEALESLYMQSVHAVFGTDDPPREHQTELARHAILEHIRDGLVAMRGDTSADDMIASTHEFLVRRLVSGVREALEADGMRSPRLCLVGGCA